MSAVKLITPRGLCTPVRRLSFSHVIDDTMVNHTPNRYTSLTTRTSTLNTISPLQSIMNTRISHTTSKVFTFETQVNDCTTSLGMLTPIENLSIAAGMVESDQCNHRFVHSNERNMMHCGRCGESQQICFHRWEFNPPYNRKKCNVCHIEESVPLPSSLPAAAPAVVRFSCHLCSTSQEGVPIECRNPHPPPLLINKHHLCTLKFCVPCFKKLMNGSCHFPLPIIKERYGSWENYILLAGKDGWVCPRCHQFCDCIDCSKRARKRKENALFVSNALLSNPPPVNEQTLATNRMTIKVKRKPGRKSRAITGIQAAIYEKQRELDALKARQFEAQGDALSMTRLATFTSTSTSTSSSSSPDVFIDHDEVCIADTEEGAVGCHLQYGFCSKYTPVCNCGSTCRCPKKQPCQHMWSHSSPYYCLHCGTKAAY